MDAETTSPIIEVWLPPSTLDAAQHWNHDTAQKFGNFVAVSGHVRLQFEHMADPGLRHEERSRKSGSFERASTLKMHLNGPHPELPQPNP